MVYTSEQQNPASTGRLPDLLDPITLRSARQIYRAYCQVRPEIAQQAMGVAMNPNTNKGQLIFRGKPILLPQECFVPLSQFEFLEDR